MFPKILQYDGHFEQTGEARCQILDPRDRRLYKYAADDTLDYLSCVEPVEGRAIVLVLAMSASEYYGPNRNGDGFSEEPVMVNGEWAIAPGETLPEHYKTFENNAHVFRHHINKDPKKSFGDVMKAFYNWNMHRVELLLSLDNTLAHDIVGRIDGGEYPGVSMGCKIKYDVCSVCGNKAPTRAQYCEHVNGSNPEYGMNRLSPEGIRYFVWNPSPFLFDISFVFRPADRIGFMMKKVANLDAPYEIRSSAALGQQVESLAEKRSVLQKASDIDKLISGDLVNPQDSVTMSEDEYHRTKNLIQAMKPWFKDGVPTVQMSDMEGIKHRSLPEVLSSFNVLGMVPTTIELFRFVCAQKGIPTNNEVERRLAKSQGKVAAAIADMPHAVDQLAKLGMLLVSEGNIRGDVMKVAAPHREKRALYKDYLARRYVPESIGPLVEETGIMDLLPGEQFSASRTYYSPTWQNLHYEDPRTGRTYQTTQRAAERADWANRKKELAEAAGLAGLLGAGYKALTSKHKWLAAPALLGAGFLGTNIVRAQQMPRVRTREGLEVPMNTEFIEKRSSALETVVPLAGGALLTALLAQDYGSADPVSPSLSQAARQHPLATTMGTSAAVGGAGALLGRLRNAVMKSASYHPANYEDVDIAELCLELGWDLLT